MAKKHVLSSIRISALATFTAAGIFTSCQTDLANTDQVNAGPEGITLANHSNIPALVKKLNGFENLETYALIGSEDVLRDSKDFVFGGSADGSGLVKKLDGSGYFMMVNHEDNYSVSRITFDKTFKPVKGEYALNSDAGQWRLCSGTMALPEVNGFGPVYLSTGESSSEARTHAINPMADTYNVTQSKDVAGLGNWSGENTVPLHKDAYPGKTVVITGEDADDASGGQLVLYLSNTVGDLDNGSQYMLKCKNGNQVETSFKAGKSYDVEFVKIENHKTLTGVQIQALVDPLKAIKFGRVEDLDFRKGSGANSRNVYFNVTGQAPAGVNADLSRTVHGRTYCLVLDEKNPLKGKLTCILDGDDDNGPAREFQNPDNICVTENYVYVQEDSNTYGDETHDAYIYQYNIASKELKKVLEIDHRRNDPKFKADATRGNWEYGSLVDISDIIGVENTFTLAIQPHTWREDKFAGVDGGAKRATENQGSQIVVIKGLPR